MARTATNTQLYKALSKVVDPTTLPQLAIELQKVIDDGDWCDWADGTSLLDSFKWHRTPQGSAYWDDLNDLNDRIDAYLES